MASLSFHLHNYKDHGELKTSPQSVFLLVTLNRSKRKRIKTPLRIEPKYWDFNKQCANRYYFDVVNFNLALSEIYKRSLEVLTKHIEKNHTPEEVYNALTNAVNGNLIIKNGFFEVFEQYIDSLRNIRTARTVQKIEGTYNLLLKFDNLTELDRINMAYFDKLREYMLTIKHKRGVGYRNDSASKHISTLKRFMYWAHQRGLHSNLIFNNKEFSIKRKSVNDIIRLTLEEVHQIEKVDLPHRLDKVRDVFLFACYTGQRWGDVISFNHSDVVNNVWSFEQGKGKKRVSVPLVGFSSGAIPIIKKYDKWPVISDQKFNEYIKEVGELALVNDIVSIKRYIGSNELVIKQPKYLFMSSHMGRRTFVSILINNGVPAPIIMKITGHSSIKTLMKYVDTNNDDVINALSKFTGQ